MNVLKYISRRSRVQLLGTDNNLQAKKIKLNKCRLILYFISLISFNLLAKVSQMRKQFHSQSNYDDKLERDL